MLFYNLGSLIKGRNKSDCENIIKADFSLNNRAFLFWKKNCSINNSQILLNI